MSRKRDLPESMAGRIMEILEFVQHKNCSGRSLIWQEMLLRVQDWRIDPKKQGMFDFKKSKVIHMLHYSN
ncbi:hypothetical protein TNCV_2380641 [Trichonephila clavipes]|nr:hypothetical protein TNCV_2380641 [Trichonephila clavipes]